ncbi:MAG TPA: glycogen synthase GlgA [Bryobacteraceae bacterium]|nr:glycogen synthase GlgA [Bryobacteraceae bacterium]
MARVLMVSSEATPLAKTGGLADVVGSLPSALRSFGDEAAVVIPRYGSIDLTGARCVLDQLPIHLGPTRYDTAVYQAAGDFPFYLLDCPPLYDRKGFYGEAGEDYPDNHIRFAVFARGALAVARYLFRTDILHCHDWQSGLVPAYLRSTFSTDPTFLGVKTLFTIHNLGYQGLFPKTVLPEIAIEPALYRPDGLEFFGRVSFIKGGIAFADALGTVSPTYAREIQTPEFGFGLDGALRARAHVLTGILNGVDYNVWSPEVDPLIPARYSAGDLSGKEVCKQHLLREFGLPPEVMERPLIGIVSRFTRQKGADLIAEVAGGLVAQNVYIVALGTGDPEYEDFFRNMAQEHPGRIGEVIGFDNALAHRIEAGADMFLMPSQYEPCGLNQIYSLRYGTVPVVRATGGLDDTIEKDTGFKFVEYSGQALLEAVREAVEMFANRADWQRRMRLGMQKDFSWKTSAGAYSALYRRLLEGSL